jgi:hypothetical protein
MRHSTNSWSHLISQCAPGLTVRGIRPYCTRGSIIGIDTDVRKEIFECTNFERTAVYLHFRKYKQNKLTVLVHFRQGVIVRSLHILNLVWLLHVRMQNEDPGLSDLKMV